MDDVGEDFADMLASGQATMVRMSSHYSLWSKVSLCPDNAVLLSGCEEATIIDHLVL